MTVPLTANEEPDSDRSDRLAREQAEAEESAKLIKAINEKRCLAAKKALQSMWVAGTVGAFFTALTRNLPIHFQERSMSPNWLYTLDRGLRYGYLVWLLIYFFISNLKASDPASIPTKWDIAYDVLQSACALVAAFALGFIAQGSGFEATSYGWAMGFANGAILVISGFSLFWWFTPPREINLHRSIGVVVSLAAIVVAVANLPRQTSLVLFALLQFILWVTLYSYIRKRLTHQPSETCQSRKY
jgi:branched-subunit amino acid transport protein AzlD